MLNRNNRRTLTKPGLNPEAKKSVLALELGFSENFDCLQYPIVYAMKHLSCGLVWVIACSRPKTPKNCSSESPNHPPIGEAKMAPGGTCFKSV